MTYVIYSIWKIKALTRQTLQPQEQVSWPAITLSTIKRLIK